MNEAILNLFLSLGQSFYTDYLVKDIEIIIYHENLISKKTIKKEPNLKNWFY